MAKKRSVLRSREYLDAGFPLYINECKQDAIQYHSHDFFEMVYVRRGRGAHMIEGDKYSIRAGDLYTIHPGESHAYLPEAGGELRIINLCWQPSLVREVLKAEGNALSPAALPYIEPLLKPRRKFRQRLHLTGSTAFRVEGLLDEMQREMESVQKGAASDGCHSLLRHLFCALLILLSRAWQEEESRTTAAGRASQHGLQREMVTRALAYLEQHATEPIRLEQVASHVALSPSRLSHLFKRETGRSVIVYLHELRLEKAQSALIESGLPVQQIAADCGFGDLRFFHRVFRRHFGCSPQQWRAQSLPS